MREEIHQFEGCREPLAGNASARCKPIDRVGDREDWISVWALARTAEARLGRQHPHQTPDRPWLPGWVVTSAGTVSG